MPESHFEYLLHRYIENKCTVREKEELMKFLDQAENKEVIQTWISEVIETTGPEITLPEEAGATILNNVLHSDTVPVLPITSRKPVLRVWMRVAVAACLLFIGYFYWFISKGDEAKREKTATARKAWLALPGKQNAMLTLADGSTISLDSIQNGTLREEGVKINKQTGLLVYEGLASSGLTNQVNYNTLSTPRGGLYQLVLPDGSKVWLNASSSLQFPTAFSGNRREVTLKGEAYFEIAADKHKPFLVKANGMEIDVLGTHFNVNAYEDENTIKASLLQGSIKIIKGDRSSLLSPGQQGIINQESDRIEIKNTDMNEVMAWRKGLFQFDGADITTIMREIGRWYDVEIIYPDKVPVRKFEGKISRDAQLSDVLKILELSNVQFTVAGRKIIVR